MSVLLLLLYTLLIVISCIIVGWIFEYVRLHYVYSKIPGPKSYPFFGASLDRIKLKKKDEFRWFNKTAYQHDSGITIMWIGTEPVISLRRPEELEGLLRSSTQIKKSRSYNNFRLWLGNGLITSTGKVWHDHRRLITPTFHYGILEEYAEVMKEQVEIFVECLESRLASDPTSPINIHEFASKYALDTICKTAMGVNVNAQRNAECGYAKAISEFGTLNIYRFYRPWLKWDAIYFRTGKGKQLLRTVAFMHDFTKKIIRQKQAERKEKMSAGIESTVEFDEFGRRKRKAFIEVLLDACESTSNPMTIEELQQEVDTFVFAGLDTTSASISWALFALGNAPEVQAKVHQELREVFGESQESATTKQLAELKYMDRVIKEVQRVYPSVPLVGREMTDDFFVGNHRIPKGTYVRVCIYQLHHDPKVWEDPERFDPDRFLPDNIRGKHPYSFLPFSAGPRNCVGQKFGLLEMKTALTAILRKWKVSSVLKPSEIDIVDNSILRAIDDRIEIRFSPIAKLYM